MARKIVNVTSRVVGPTGSSRRRWAMMLSFALILGSSLFFMQTVSAVHETGRFELDGNATSQTTDDWDRVCFDEAKKEGKSDDDARSICGAASQPTNGAIAVSWVSEPDRATSIFTGGGSKDPQDLNQWAWKNAGGLPDKDNLRHAYAVRYSLPNNDLTCPSGGSGNCEVLFFGLDRFDNSGDAQTGFWFLQNPVALGDNAIGGGNGFTGVHKAGDLLVISDFSIGGTVSTITVLKWDPTCKATGRPKGGGADGLFCADANLEQLATSDQANCASVAGGNDPFCGLVNDAVSQPPNGLITMPWQFADKSGTPNNGALPGEFYEAGINLSFLHLANECFSSVVSETRSSTSTTATLKDFIVGQFANCVPGLTTQASANFSDPVIPTFEVHDVATVKVTGGANPADPTGTVTFYLCGPFSAPTDCTSSATGYTNIGTGTLDGGSVTNDGQAIAVSPDVNTDAHPLAAGVYCFRAEWPGDNTYKTPQSHTDTTLECFAVKDTSSTVTAQNWIPNDSAAVTTASGATATGSVTFTLYDNGTCDGSVLLGPITIALDGTGSAKTSNDSPIYSPGATVSWLAVFNPTDPAGLVGSTATCEKSVVTITDK